jgi:hypothetical protein
VNGKKNLKQGGRRQASGNRKIKINCVTSRQAEGPGPDEVPRRFNEGGDPTRYLVCGEWFRFSLF